MKKYISFLILFIPWLFTIFIIPFNNTINTLLTIFIFISLIFYFFISLLFYKIIEYDEYNIDVLLSFILLYIFNQYFNASLFYYKNFLITVFLSIFMFISYIYLLRTYYLVLSKK